MLIYSLQLVKARKPTGSGEVPCDVQEARDIQKVIDSRSGIRNIDDFDMSDNDDMCSNDTSIKHKLEVDNMQDPIFISSDDEEQLSRKKYLLKTEDSVEPKASVSKAPILNVQTVHTGAPKAKYRRSTQSLGGAADLIKLFTDSLNPGAQLDRDRNRNDLHMQYLLTLSQQVRDLASTIESLRREAASLQDRLHTSERRGDQAEMQYKILKMRQGSSAPRIRNTHEDKYERIFKFRDGGEKRSYVRSDEEDDPFAPEWLPQDLSPPKHGCSLASTSQYSYTPIHAKEGHHDVEGSHSTL